MTLFETIVRALTPTPDPWELDPSIELHPTWEQPVWDLAVATEPEVMRWLTPQAPLDTLAGLERSSSWVDFLYCSPWRQIDHVIEIDGSSHRRQLGLDHDRDKMLETAGCRVHRLAGAEAVEPDGPFARLIRAFRDRRSDEQSVPVADAATRRSWTPLEWRERWHRPGWHLEYTILSGRLGDADPLRGLEDIALEKCTRLASDILIATNTGTETANNDAMYWASVCRKILQRGDRPPVSPRTEDLLGAQFAEPDGSLSEQGVSERILGPAAVQRLGLAITEGVRRGDLAPGSPWNISLVDPTGLVGSGAGGVLDLLAAVDDVWSTGIVPDSVTIGATQWERSARFEPQPASGHGAPDLHVVLDPFTPPHAALPATDGPTVVVRSAYLPVHPAWLAPLSKERRNVVPTGARQNALTRLLKDLFGHPEFREGQLGAILRALAGHDTVVMLPTGAGKSLIFQLAGLLRPGLTIAVDPLVSLINDQTRGLQDQGISRVAHLTASSLSGENGKALLHGIGRGDFCFAFLTPERLQTRKFRDQLVGVASHGLVNLAIVDEAHCVSEWGHDFRTSYLYVARNLRLHCCGVDDEPPPLLALTATASPSVRRDMFRELELDETDPETIQTPSSHDRPELHYAIQCGTPQDRHPRLSRTVFERVPEDLGEPPADVVQPREDKTTSGIVFVPHVNGRFGIVDISGFLEQQAGRLNLETVVGMYGGAPRGWDSTAWEQERQENARSFIENETPILVATKGFGMGIDKPNIRYTIHYGIPPSIEAFAQEAGRAGRDGIDSFCHLLPTLPDASTTGHLLDLAIDADTRRVRYEERNAVTTAARSTDIDHQLYFHFNSFKSAQTETAATRRLFTELWDRALQTPGASIGVSRSSWPNTGRSETTAGLREKALFRLSVLGIVHDYTVQFPRIPGAVDSFEIELDDFDATGIDNALRSFGTQLEPGRGETLETEIRGAPDDLAARCRHHVGLLVDILYRTVEPARIRALDEMYRLASADLDSAAIAARIGAYLGDGLLASSLEATIDELRASVPVDALLTVLRTLPLVEQQEREGATARQLERTPNHPLALLASAMTQAWAGDGDRDRFRLLAAQAFENFTDYVPDDAQAAEIFVSLIHQVRSLDRGARAGWCADLWRAWPRDRVDVIAETATEALDSTTWSTLEELSAILEVRVMTDTRSAVSFVSAQVGDSES